MALSTIRTHVTVYRSAMLTGLVLLLAIVPLASGSVAPRPGSLDKSFGKNGTVLTAMGRVFAANAATLQPNGRIVIAGEWSSQPGTEPSFALGRYFPNGALDGSFGDSGLVQTDFGDTSAVNAVTLQPDGKIIAAGFTRTAGAGAEFALARYKPNGSLDPTFGSAGRAETSIGTAQYAAINAVALQRDGRIVVAGYAGTTSGGDNSDTADFALARYLPNGSLDTTFGNGGTVITNLSGDDFAAAVLVQSDGKIVAVGGSEDPRGYGSDFALARYLPDGALDSSFGNGGTVLTVFPEGGAYAEAASAVLQLDGKIVAAGYAYGFGLARYNADGSLDKTFGAGGMNRATFGSILSESSRATSAVLEPNGDIVLGGFDDEGNGGFFGLIRFTRKGRVDRYFGRNGRVTTAVGPSYSSSASALLRDQKGRLLAAGWAALDDGSYGGGGDVAAALARYQSGTVFCVVPNVLGRRVPHARRALNRANCVLAHAHYRPSARVPKGRVISQRPRAGKRLRAGSKVNLVVSLGR
jgi:uncharacterized delta-60 repeat protein